jgi:hypothetical protein
MLPLPPVRLGPPCRRPILIATKNLVFRGQDTSEGGRAFRTRSDELRQETEVEWVAAHDGERRLDN